MKIRPNTLDNYILKEMPQYLKKINLKSSDVWLDAGANIGAFANTIQNKVGKVICFEPEEENFKLLMNNIDLSKCKTYQRALVGNQDRTRNFFINERKNKGTHSFLVKRGRKQIKVICSNINEVISTHKINKIKMDVEGAEYELLMSIIDRNWLEIKELIFEFHFLYLKDKEYKQYKELLAILAKHFDYLDYKEDPKKNWTTLVYARRLNVSDIDSK